MKVCLGISGTASSEDVSIMVEMFFESNVRCCILAAASNNKLFDFEVDCSSGGVNIVGLPVGVGIC